MKQKQEKTTFAEESRSSGTIPYRVYWNYFISGGGCFPFFVFIVNSLMAQILFSGSDFWLTLWTNSEERRARDRSFTDNSSILTNSSSEENPFNVTEVIDPFAGPAPFTGDWWKDPDTYTGVYVFTILIVGVFVFTMIRTIHYFLMCMTSSVNLHNNMFQSVIRAPLLFFDQNPVGK